jgi:hypothetical protein
MEYLGIVWLTSWVMEFFSSHNTLITTSEYLDQSSEANILFVANDSGQTEQQKQKTDRRKSSHENLTSISQNHWIEPLLHFLQARQSASPEFCRPPETITTQTQLSSFLPVLMTSTSSSKSAQLVSQSSKGDDSSPTMKWMENILPFSAMGESKRVESFPMVQVVRVNDTNSDGKSAESMYQIWVKGCLIGKMPHSIPAYAIALQIQHLLQDPNFDPRQIKAKMIDDRPGVKAGSQLLFVVDDTLAEQLDRHAKVIALQWINNLRQALDTLPLTFAETQAQMYGLAETGQLVTGLASWYGPYFHGRLTANGEIYNQYDLTAAHRSLPFDTYLKVTNLDNGKSVIVRINDRGPYIPPRNLDLSLGAARQLGSEDTGVIEYKAVIMKPDTEVKQPAVPQVTKL